MRFVLRKISSAALTLLAVSAAVFFSFSLIPGDPALRKLGTEATPEALERLRVSMGIDGPLISRYFSWLFNFTRGDFGVSYSYDIPVATLLSDKLGVTLTLVFLSFAIVVLISIPAGLLHARFEGRLPDRLGLVAGQIFMAIPPFFMGIIVTFVFGITLHLFTPGGFVPPSEDLAAFLSYMIFPAISIAIPRAAMTFKLLRGSILSEARKDYVRTAYSRGNSTMEVLYSHVLKNALLPVITFLAMNLTDIVAGSVIIEQVFGIPGFGRFLLVSILGRDYPVVEAIIMGLAAFVIVVNLVTDLLYGLIDPRVGLR